MVSSGHLLTRLALGLSESGWQVNVLAGRPNKYIEGTDTKKKTNYHGLYIERIKSTNFVRSSFIGRLINDITFSFSALIKCLVMSKESNLLIVTNPPLLIPMAWILSSIRKDISYSILLFDLYPQTLINLNKISENGLIAKSLTLMNYKAYLKSKVIFSIGRCMTDILIDKAKNHNIAIKDKITNINIWCDDELLLGDKSRRPIILDNAEVKDKFIVLYSGTMGLIHDIETILQTAQSLEEEKDIHFLFIGDGPQRTIVEDFIKVTKCHNVTIGNFVRIEELAALFDGAAIGIVSLKLGHEGASVPSKALSIFAAGKPTIALMSKKSEISRLIRDNNIGFVIDPGNCKELKKKIMLLRDDRNLCNKMGNNARLLIREKLQLKNTIKDINASLR